MNEVRELLGDGDRAARDGDWSAARGAFVEAAVCASTRGQWRAAVRCYRSALELDLADHEIVRRISRIAGRNGNAADWARYAELLEQRADWPRFGCRTAQIVLGDLGGVVTCAGMGPVLEVMMARDDIIDAYPDTRLGDMPLAMALLILRRALWPAPRDDARTPHAVHVTFDATRVRLDELGDWQPLGVGAACGAGAGVSAVTTSRARRARRRPRRARPRWRRRARRPAPV